ncbi:branched-chain amino acid ABC transporter permease [Candidatus Bathyarchaeota archaeon]|jgi:branched-chain amino acid transport system permease protein|nr:branched-chain amino acid ABC transporter permease [Candidatus Bathyarchaeota archaeon]MBT4321068.1 branched-chain amino acid ABC transporter permease [Candidatus Bathyarchaeota archaeon]MBT6605313.1 branched-chain amino acid ABC transporter permease [Candidatus Bathyarchaeota archaeon]MBT7186802.1 branched-chain amino acid ABC transporter permease [Candidatus Bathyarchaeota archaeon]MBT7345792.1 branched-chain amino acid ABC transporter permease [Candidatus Bathyarchaeota archaeon]
MIIPAIWMAALVYASELTLLSIGFTLTYLTSKIPNFAHGTYAGIGIYVSYTFSKILGISPYLGFPMAFLLGGIFSVLVYLIVIKVLTDMGGGAIVLTIATLAIQIFLTAILQVYAYYLREKYSTYTMQFLLKEFDFAFGGFPGIFIVSISMTVGLVLVLHYMLTRTKMGIAMRATAEDPELASVLGININKIQLFSWFLTGGLACLAGAMIPLWFQSSPASGAMMITSIMAGSLLGGFDSIYGSVIGGVIVGMSEIMLTTWGQSLIGVWVGEYRPMIPMIFLVVILMIEPDGLQGAYKKFAASDFGENILKSIGLMKEDG